MASRPSLARAATVVLSLAAACAHGGPPPAPPPPAPVWPHPPELARARYAGVLPRAAEPEKASWWRRTLSAIVGSDDRPHAEAGVLARPFGVALQGSDVLVADPDRPGVLRFAWPAGTWQRIECDGRAWSGPLGVAAAPDGAVYVADGGAGEVVRVDREGRCAAFGRGALERPSGVAVSHGRVYTVDPPRHTVVAFDADGREALRFGTRGEADGQLNFPTAIAADDVGDLLVVDALNFRIVRFSPDGKFRSKFGQPGDVEGTLGRPKGVAASGDRIFVSDAQYDVVLVFRPSGDFGYLIGEPGVGPGELAMPAGVAVAGRLLFVANAQARRVEVYELLEGES